MANTLDIYSIGFKGLSLGKHTFEFDLDDKFFHEFEEGEINHGQLKAQILLLKQNHLMELRCNINGVVEVFCDRCLEAFNLPISYKGTLYVKIKAEENSNDDDIIFLSEDEYEINLAQYLYESVCLSIPIKRFHGLNGTNIADCDAEMLSRMNNEPHEDKTEIDPRWAKLQDLTKN